MTSTRWRLLLDPPADGATNMARDEALARHAHAAPLPTLRLYSWSPACMSLGRFQRADDVNADAAARAGIDLVRRPSGGRAILHAHELTYAVVAPATLPLLAGGVRDTYCAISRALLVGLRLLGVEAELAPCRRRTADRRPQTADRRPQAAAVQRTTMPAAVVGRERSEPSAVGGRPASCFDSASDYEVTVGGRKLIGSAQVRAYDAILQHGSLPLSDPTPLLRTLLTNPPADLGAHSIALDAAAGRVVSWEEAARALVAGFEECWGVEFVPEELIAEVAV